MSMNYRRPISWTYWEQRWAQREAELAHLQTRGMRLLIVGSLILLAVGLTLIANKWPLAHRCLRVADAIDLTDPCGPKAPKVHGRTSTTRTTSKVRLACLPTAAWKTPRREGTGDHEFALPHRPAAYDE
jgi:hypothetical protein